jgi:hypothetical protein
MLDMDGRIEPWLEHARFLSTRDFSASALLASNIQHPTSNR